MNINGAPFKCTTKARAATDFLVVHCSASNPKTNPTVQDIDKEHRERGFQCIGYHYVIRKDGDVWFGRSHEVVGSHVENWNHNSVGICMVGGVDGNIKPLNNFTAAQFASLKTLLADLRKIYPKAVIQGHRDFPQVSKACPSFDAKAWAKTEGF